MSEENDEKPVVRGVITKSGEFVEQQILNQYAVKDESKQLPADSFLEGGYDSAGAKKPPYSLETLAELPEKNTWHYRAIKAKVMDTVGHGHRLCSDLPEDEEPSEEQKENWEEFVARTEQTTGQSLDEVLFEFQWDYEAIGNGFLELVPDIDRETIHHVEPVPGHTIRRGQDREIQMATGGGTINGKKLYIQRRGGKSVYFKEAGAEFDVHHQTGNIYPEGHLDIQQAGNEILHVENITARSDFYGLPDVMPSLIAILGDREAAKFNVDFFESHGIPSYAVTVTGAELDEQTEKTIHKYFTEEVQKNRHGTLVLSAQQETDAMGESQPIDMKFEKLSTEVQNASFRMYREDNREEILSAHGVPAYRAAIAVTGSLGQNAAREMDEIYKSNVVDFRQKVLEKRFKSLILERIECEDWRLEFDRIDTTDEQHEDDRTQKYFNMGALTPNEVRERLGKDPVDPEEHEGMDEFFINGQPISMLMEEAGGGGEEEAGEEGAGMELMNEGQNAPPATAKKGSEGSGNWDHPGQEGEWGGAGSGGGGDNFNAQPGEVRGSLDPETGRFDEERHEERVEQIREEEGDAAAEEYDSKIQEYKEAGLDAPEGAGEHGGLTGQSLKAEREITAEGLLGEGDREDRREFSVKIEEAKIEEKEAIYDDAPNAIKVDDPELYHDVVSEAKEANEYGQFVDAGTPEGLGEKDMYLYPGGEAGFTVAEDGTIGNLFKNPDLCPRSGVASEACLQGIKHGGDRLDNFDGRLTEIYGQVGFEPQARLEFDPEQAPDDWNYERDGEPDVVFSSHVEPDADIDTIKRQVEDGEYFEQIDTDGGEYADSYGEALEMQDEGVGTAAAAEKQFARKQFIEARDRMLEMMEHALS